MSRAQRRTPRILVVDDDPGLLRLLTIRLRSEKYEVEPVESAAKALATIAQSRPDLVITDLRMAEMDGIGLLKELQRRWPSLNVIMLTAHGTIPDAVRATQSGAFAFLTKPVEKEQLLEEVRRALKTSGLGSEPDDWPSRFATRSPLLEGRLAKARMLAATDAPVLIVGEPGTGKELLARAIHAWSDRGQAPLVIVDAGQLETAETARAVSRAVEESANGALCVRNVDELSAMALSELERAIESADVRLLATSDLPEDIQGGAPSAAMEALDRLGAVRVELPPLAGRREDIPLLVGQCLEQMAAENGQPRRACSPEAIEFMASSEWPGNVRQLRTVLRQAAAAGSGPLITAEQVRESRGQVSQLPSFDEARDEFTRNYLVQLLKITGGNVAQAARLAKRNRTDFYKLLTRHEVQPEDFKH
jgi:two-component system response regulator GlrR